jgi:EAL domain-containing protein (putative c-di-GMP-specific phosphodiesterase class I)
LSESPELPRHIQSLSLKTDTLSKAAQDEAQQNAAACAAACLESLSAAIDQKKPIFGIEPWHKVHKDAPLPQPGEMLLRLKDASGNALPPYPAIMAFYNNGMAAEIDTILALCAVQQFKDSDEQQISVNVSGRSMRDAGFIKTVLPVIESMKLPKTQKIIFEIHESAPSEIMSPRVLDLCRRIGIAFAIDDVGLSLNDIFRLSQFEQIADFIKLDRKWVMTKPGEKMSLDNLMALIGATLPNAYLVAEGVKSAEHAAELHRHHKNIHYMQGMHLPPREVFAQEWADIKAATVA